MIQITNICNKCGAEISDKEKVYHLSLIDNKNETYFTTDGGKIAIAPRTLWRYCFCKKCFNEFNQNMKLPYKE